MEESRFHIQSNAPPISDEAFEVAASSAESLRPERTAKLSRAAIRDALLKSHLGLWGGIFSIRVRRRRKQAIAPHLAFERPTDIDRFTYSDLTNIEQFYAPIAERLPEKQVVKRDLSRSSDWDL